MSDPARHLFALKQGRHQLMDYPRNTPEYEHQCMHMEWRIRAWAEFLIAWGC